VRLLVAAAWITACVWGCRRVPRRRLWAPVAASILLVQAGWALRSPSSSRAWLPEQSRTPRVTVKGDALRVENVRNFRWQSVSEFDEAWETREYDLSRIESLDFLIVPFSSWRGLAHVFLSFGFEGGERLAISVEVRKEPREKYHPLAGMFRNYEIIYIVGDERDLVGLRAFVEREPVEIHPIGVTRGSMRRMLLSMLRRAEALHARPEFYNSVTNNCTTNVVRHYEELSGKDLGADWRVLFPGYADELARELGLLRAGGSNEAARVARRVPAHAPEDCSNGAEWSRAIRSTLGNGVVP